MKVRPVVGWNALILNRLERQNMIMMLTMMMLMMMMIIIIIIIIIIINTLNRYLSSASKMSHQLIRRDKFISRLYLQFYSKDLLFLMYFFSSCNRCVLCSIFSIQLCFRPNHIFSLSFFLAEYLFQKSFLIQSAQMV